MRRVSRDGGNLLLSGTVAAFHLTALKPMNCHASRNRGANKHKKQTAFLPYYSKEVKCSTADLYSCSSL